MILKLLFLHKNKNIDIEELKNDFSSVFKIKNNEFFYRDINYKFDIVKAQESNNIVFSISTTKSGNNLENAILIEDIKNSVTTLIAGLLAIYYMKPWKKREEYIEFYQV